MTSLASRYVLFLWNCKPLWMTGSQARTRSEQLQILSKEPASFSPRACTTSRRGRRRKRLINREPVPL